MTTATIATAKKQQQQQQPQPQPQPPPRPRPRQRQRQQQQLQPPFGPSVDSVCHPCITTTHLSYSVLSLKLPPPPCAALLAYIYIYIAPSIYNTWFDIACIQLKIKTWSQRLEVYTLVWEQSSGNMEVESVPFCKLCEALRCSWREKWGETMDTLPF